MSIIKFFCVPKTPLTLRFFFYPKESGRIGLIKLYLSRLGEIQLRLALSEGDTTRNRGGFGSHLKKRPLAVDKCLHHWIIDC